jgi:hypothetical protein
MAKNRFRRTPEEIELGLTVDQAKQYRKTGELPKEGLGDKIEKVTKATGIKAFVEFLNGGKECEGCNKRKEWLNSLRFRRKALPMTVGEYEWIKDYTKRKTNTVKASDSIRIAEIHARLWNYKYSPPGNCSSCVVQKVNDLEELFNAYNETL